MYILQLTGVIEHDIHAILLMRGVAIELLCLWGELKVSGTCSEGWTALVLFGLDAGCDASHHFDYSFIIIY